MECGIMRLKSLFAIFGTLLAVAASTGVLAADPTRPHSLTLGTASPGGVYYIYGEALAQILTEKLGIPINPFPTQGSIQNVKLLDSGGAQLGMITMSTGLEGWNGTGEFASAIFVRCFQCTITLFRPWSCSDPALRHSRSSTRSASALDRARGTAPPTVRESSGLSGFHPK
jgi:hypothetical protein